MLNKDSKILIVDDSQSVRGMVTQFFAKKMGIPENNPQFSQIKLAFFFSFM